MSHVTIFRPCSDTAQYVFDQVSTLIAYYVQQGLMVSQSPARLRQLAENDNLVVATQSHRVIACAAITVEYPDGSKEFGGWAVDPDFQDKKIGKQLLQNILQKHCGVFVFAVANQHSAKIFQHLGAREIATIDIHPDVFIVCKTCNCDKSRLSAKAQCVDTFHDLRPLMDA